MYFQDMISVGKALNYWLKKKKKTTPESWGEENNTKFYK